MNEIVERLRRGDIDREAMANTRAGGGASKTQYLLSLPYGNPAGPHHYVNRLRIGQAPVEDEPQLIAPLHYKTNPPGRVVCRPPV